MSEEYTRGQTGRGRKQLFTTAAHTRQEVLRGGGLMLLFASCVCTRVALTFGRASRTRDAFACLSYFENASARADMADARASPTALMENASAAPTAWQRHTEDR